MSFARRTLRSPSQTLSGVGVRYGATVTVRLLPARPGQGLTLCRTDLPALIPVSLEHALDAPSCTAIGASPADATLFVEHIMATLAIHALTDLTIEVSGPEIPLLDGSALPWDGLIMAAGIAELPGAVEPIVVRETVRLGDADKWIEALPSDEPCYAFELAYANPLIGAQTAAFCPGQDEFASFLAPARTFALVEEIAQATAAGLLKGGSADNCRIVYADHVSDPTTLPDEYARHKILDMLGDLYLAGRPILGRIAGHRTGHAHNRALLRRLLDVC